jgi:hypothetical protein
MGSQTAPAETVDTATFVGRSLAFGMTDAGRTALVKGGEGQSLA